MKEGSRPGLNSQISFITPVEVENSLEENGRSLLERIRERERTVLRMPELINGRREKFSIFDIPNWERSFTPVSGAIILSRSVLDSSVSTFYTSERMHKDSATSTVTNRGVNYYVAMDPIKGTTKEKIASIQDDVNAGLTIFHNTDRDDIRKPDDFIHYLGVLDYLKNGFSVAYNALTFYEKAGFKNNDEEYRENRASAEELAILSNRIFYKTLLGHEYDSGIDSDTLAKQSAHLFSYMQTKTPPIDPDHFRNPENENAVRILQNAYLNAKEHAGTTLILGLLTGGLESAVATQVVFEGIHHQSPRLEVARLSLHSARRIFKKEMSSDDFIPILKDKNVKGEDILVTDDCVCTGQTTDVVVKSLTALQAANVHVSVTELIPLPLIVQKALYSNHPGTIVDLTNPDYNTIVGFSPQQDLNNDSEQSNFRQVRRLEAFSVLYDFYSGQGDQNLVFNSANSQSPLALLEQLRIKEFS